MENRDIYVLKKGKKLNNRYVIDENGEPSIENIEDDDEWDMVNDYFESLYSEAE